MSKFKQYQQIAEQNGFIFERSNLTYRGAERYDLCTNDKLKGLGTTTGYMTLAEASHDIEDLLRGVSPLNGYKFR